MIKWSAQFNLTLFMLIFSMATAYSQEASIVPDVDVKAEDCEEITDVIPTCLNSRTTPSNPAELITGDLAVCNCIDKTRGNILAANNPSASINSEEARKIKERRIEQIGRIAATSNVLNSTSYATDVESVNRNLIGFGAGEIRAELKKQPVSIDGQPIDMPMLDEAFSKIGQIPAENASWQCISIQEYQAHRTIPTDNKFYEMLKSSTLNPADWNETTLKTQFDTATDANRENIRQKLIFLSRNPIFKAILKAQPTETISAEMIAAKQTQILQAIQKLKPAEDSTCFTRPNGCWRELQGSGKVNEFKSEAMSITNDPVVHDIASAQNAKTYLDELRRLTAEGQIEETTSIPTTLEGYFAFMQNANADIARRCAGTNVDASCYVSFANHCSTLRMIDNRVRIGLRVTSSELSDQLFEEEATEARMDPNNNPAFRAFNDSICLQAFADSQGRMLNYFQYQEQHCTGENKYPECTDRKRLLARFLREHNSGDDEVAASVRSSFGELVETNDYVDATAAQVATANNISESPAQIRARFGGEYPTITPKGEIKAPVTSVASDASGTGSTTTQSSTVDSSATTVGVVAPVVSQDNRIQSKIPVSTADASISSQDSQNYVTAVRNPTPTFFGALNRFEPSQTPVIQPDIKPVTNIVSTSGQSDVDTKESKVPETSIIASSGASGVVAASNGSSPRSSGPSTVAGGGSSSGGTTTVGVSKTNPKTPQNLNFKYGLNRDGTAIQPDVQIIPVVNQVLPVTLDQASIDRIKENPASLVLSSSQVSEILANPSSEVPVQIKSNSGEALTVYAKKDIEGNITYSLESGSGRSPASNGNVVRARLSASTYENVLRDPDTALNQNEDLVNELASKEDGSTITLQIVSEGKRALTFEVTKKDDLLYHYRLKR